MIKKLTKYIVSLGLGVTLLFAGAKVNAATTFFTNITANTTNMATGITNGAQIYQIQLVGNSSNNLTVLLFDGPSTNSTYAVLAYTNSIINTVTLTNIYTNILGTIQTNIYTNIMNTVITNVPQANGYTNGYNVLWYGVVASNTTVTYTPPINVFAFQGIGETNTAFTNTGSLGINITYLLIR